MSMRDLGIFGALWAVMAMLYLPALADESMNLIMTIGLPDSLNIESCASIGDFNADGYDDLLVGVSGPSHVGPIYYAAYLYFGGPQFDGNADLVFIGETSVPPYYTGGFGRVISGLDDFNGDGYDDIAIGATGFNDIVGRIYMVALPKSKLIYSAIWPSRFNASSMAFAVTSCFIDSLTTILIQ